ncbi:MAG TPA: glycosyltransferase [Nitrospiraceae bacterium]|nr:glycosyltransferase [Nitrospiraceae bacterium]
MNTFESNLSVVESRDPRLAYGIREAGGGALTVTSARSGLPTAQHKARWIHSAYDPLRESESWAAEQTSLGRPREILVIMGVGLLYHVEALRRRVTTDTDMMVVVPDLTELHDAFAARPMEELLQTVGFLTGSPETVADELTALASPLRLVSYAPAMVRYGSYFSDLEQQLRRRLASRAGGQLNIAVVGPIYGGSLPIARYAVHALEQLGHKVRWIDHSVHDRSYEECAKLGDQRNRLVIQGRFADVLSQFTLAQLAEDPPDVVLALAQAPLTSVVLEHLRRKKFVCAMWFVENYRHLTYWQQLAASYDYWFVIQRESCRDALRQAGAGDVIYMPMAADPLIHRPLDLSADEREEFGSDVSFVGAGYANRRALLPKLIAPGRTFKLWGNEWDGADALQGILQHGGARIDTATCMQVFNASRINLNLHSWSGSGLDPQADFVNPRTFELAACGAFQLVDYRSLLPDLFTAEEVVSFKTVEELPSLIGRWLADPDARAAAALGARRRVLAEHTYVHRMKEILSHIGMSRPDRVGSILNGERQADALTARCDDIPVLGSLMRGFPSGHRVELKDVAGRIRSKAPHTPLAREELLVLMLDEYRSEMRDIL